jgi:STE24 endopeptidase
MAIGVSLGFGAWYLELPGLTKRAMKSQLIAGLCLVVLTLPAAAAVAPSPTPPPAAILYSDNPTAFDPAAATQAWLDTVPADKRQKSDAYFEGGYWLILWNFLLSGAILLILLATGLSRRWRDLAEKLTRFRWLQVVLYSLPFTLVPLILGFPMELYQNFFREHAYNLSTQSFGSWMRDETKAAIANLIGSIIFLSALYAVFRRAPRLWWAFGVAVSTLLFIIAVMLGPVFISPLFNKYQPLTDPAIRDPILALARANEIPVNQIYQFDASKQTNRVSANVSGALGTTRISLNDNLLNQCSLPEIRQVMSHEMGHFVLNHTAKMMNAFLIGALIAFLFARLLFDWSVRKWGDKWGIRGISDPAGLPLLALIFLIFSFIATPITNTGTRIAEREADAFSINACREPDAMAQVALKLGSYRKLNPGPLEEFIFFDHPSGRARIRMAMDWKAAQIPCGNSSGSK